MIATLGMCGGIVGSVANDAFGQASNYRVRLLDFLPGCHQSEARAINEDGVIVGTCWEDDGTARPTVWFPCAWSSGDSPVFIAWAPYDLCTMSGEGLGGEAFDINDDRVIVGYQTYSSESFGVIHRPFVWDLSAWVPNPSGGGSFRYTVLGEFSEEFIRGGEAQGVNNASPPIVVGFASDDEGCQGEVLHYGFSHLMNEDPTVLTKLMASVPWETQARQTEAYAVTTSIPYKAVGMEKVCGAIGGCQTNVNALRWNIPTGFSGPEAAYVEAPDPALSQASDINDNLYTVGWERYQMPFATEDPQVICRFRAALWNPPVPPNANALVDLHGPYFSVFEETKIHGITQVRAISPSLVAVGEEISFIDGVVWQLLPQGWIAALADQLQLATCDIHISRLNDISSSSLWAVGVADPPPESDPPGIELFKQAVLMWHRRCDGDVNNDSVVDAVDLAILLGAWGPWPDSCNASTLPDQHEDGVVDAIDLAVLLGAWGTLCCPATGNFSFGTQLALSGTGMAISPADAIISLGFESLESFSTWFDNATPEQRIWAVATLSSLTGAGQGGDL